MTDDPTPRWDRPARTGPRWPWLAAAVALVVVAGGTLDGSREDAGLTIDEEPPVEENQPVDEDDDGLAASDGGPLTDASRWTVHANPDDTASIAPTPEGGAWAGTRAAGLVRWDADGGDSERHLAQQLAGRAVTSVVVADDGTVWATARGDPGIRRYDGSEWSSHTRDDGLPHNEVLSLAVADGVLWAGTDQGLARFAGGEWTAFDDELPHSRVTSVATAADGAVWAVTGEGGGPSGGLARLADGEWTVWNRYEDFSDGRILDVATGADGGVWLMLEDVAAADEHEFGGHRLLRRDGDGWVVVADNDALPRGELVAFTVDAGGAPWAGFRRRSDERSYETVVGRFDGQAWTIEVAENELPGTAQGLTADGRGRVWAATTAGVARLTEGRWRLSVTGEGPASNALASLAVRDGTVWAGSLGDRHHSLAPPAPLTPPRARAAVSRFDGQQWTRWALGDGVPDRKVSGLAAGPDGTVWAAMSGEVPGTGGPDVGGVARFDGTAWVAADGFDHDHATSIAVADDGTVWALVIDVLGVIDEAPGPTRPDLAFGVARFDGEQWTSWTEAGPFAGRRPTSLAVDAAGDAWVGLTADRGLGRSASSPEGGVARFAGGEWELFTVEDGLPDGRLSALAADDHTVWAAAGDSIARFDGQRWVDQTGQQGDGPGVDSVEVLAVDDGSVWAATHRSLSRFDGQRWATVALDELPMRHIDAIAAGDEAVWLATRDGLARFDRGRS